jgi:hypothetical protein
LGVWITGDGKHNVDLKGVRMLDDKGDDWGQNVYFCKGICQTRGWKFGDWWCEQGHHVWAGRRVCGKCERDGIEAKAPSSVTIEVQYRGMFEEHNQRVWDAHQGFVEVWNQGDTVLVMKPGSRIVGDGNLARSASLWTSIREIQVQTSAMDGVKFLQGTDVGGRRLVSNNTGIIGGLTDGTIMRDVLMEINKIGKVIGFVPKLNEWCDRSGNKRLSWGHPSYVMFQHELDLENVMSKYQKNSKRPDGGKDRTLKIEWSTGELLMPVDSAGGPIEKVHRSFGPRFDPGICADLRDGICTNMVATSLEGEEFEILGVPAEEWPCNRGRSVRRFPGGLVGEEADDYEYAQTDDLR